MNIKDIIEMGVIKFYGNGEAKKIKANARQNLENKDWLAFVNEMYMVPREEDVKAPNEEHVKLYDKDIEEIKKIQDEMAEHFEREVPEYIGFSGFEKGNYGLHSHKQPWIHTWSASGKLETTFSEKLVIAEDFLSEARTGLDLSELVLYNFSIIQEALEDDDKQVRIAQKGKTGEENFSRILNQYSYKYHTLENIVIPAAPGDGISSETDAYVITDKGVFVCEVKNYGKEGQTLFISEDDRWYMLDSETGRMLETKVSATEQNKRHCRATTAFLEKHLGTVNIPIIPVVVIANNEVELVNRSQNPVIYASEIEGFIEQYNNSIDGELKNKIRAAFMEHKMDMVDYPVKLNKGKAEHAKKNLFEMIPHMKANVQIANEMFTLRKKCNLISYVVIAAICGLLALIFGDYFNFVPMVTMIIGFLIACFSRNKGAVICGTATVLLWMWILITGGSPYNMLLLVCFFGSIYFAVKGADE